MLNFVWGVVASILATILSALGVFAYRHYRSGRGMFVGEWDQHIPAAEDQPAKHDLVTCRQHGARVYGRVKRIEPTAENWKDWGFEGRVRENVVAATFWSADAGVNSFGTMLLVHSGEHRYEGYYTKHAPAERNLDRIADERRRIYFEWRKRRAAAPHGA
jgi:hypothetical protein